MLDNATNNDTTLDELAKHLDFDPEQRRLRCMGHIINLIAESYIFGQDASTWEKNFTKSGPGERRKLWRQRGELGKLHNLVVHVTASGKRTELFQKLQLEANTGIASKRVWKLVLDGGIRWNSTYSMIQRALDLKEALDIYALKLRVSTDEYDQETYQSDYLTEDEWAALRIIKEQLEPLFYLTKSLEGNADLEDGARQASHGALWEILPVFQHLLVHWEKLEKESKVGKFQKHPGIQSSITLAWNTTTDWYKKTDQSIAWVASMVLHPRFKYQWFEKHWTAPGEAASLKQAKTKLKRHWEAHYKGNDNLERRSKSPEAERPMDFLEEILNSQTPLTSRKPARASSRQDELSLYLQEPPEDRLGLMEYWKSREKEWPHLAAMAYDFHAIPAMSSECERVFSSCGKMTTPESTTVETRYKHTLRTMICMLIERNAYKKGSRESQIWCKFLIQLPIQLAIQLRRDLCIAKERRNRGLFYCLLLNSIYLPLKLIKTQHYTSFYYLSPICSIRLL